MLEESTPHRVSMLESHQWVTAPCGSYVYSPLFPCLPLVSCWRMYYLRRLSYCYV